MIQADGVGQMANLYSSTQHPSAVNSSLNRRISNVPLPLSGPLSYQSLSFHLGVTFGLNLDLKKMLHLCGLYGIMLLLSTHGEPKLLPGLTHVVFDVLRGTLKPPYIVSSSVLEPRKYETMLKP